MTKYLITGAQSHAPVNKPFLKGLETYAKEKDAEILILPLPGYTKLEDGELPKELNKFEWITKRTKLNDSLSIRDFSIRPQRIEPTTGLTNIIQKDESTIFASTKQRLKIIPNSNNNLPKALITTGVVTHGRYRDGFTVSDKARAHHTYGAVFVDLEDKTNYHFRQFRASSRGRFSDLDRYVDQEDMRFSNVKYMVLGDWHHGMTDPEVESASHRLIEETNPESLIFHDFFDGQSVNFYNNRSIITKGKIKHNGGFTNLEDELDSASKDLTELAEMYPDKQFYLVACNHHDKLQRFIAKQEFTKNPHNIYIGSKLLTKTIEGKDAVEEGFKLFRPIPENVKFLSRRDDLKYRGIQLASHGDLGMNGSRRFAVSSREKVYGKSMSGHSHSPQILRDTYVMGTSTTLTPDYARGPSSWLNTHGLVFDTGKMQLVNIIEGRYKSE